MSDFNDFPPGSMATLDESGAVRSSLVRRLEGMQSSEQYRSLLALVRTETIEVARSIDSGAPEALADGQTFKDLGFGSLAAIDLHARLTAAIGLELPLAMAFNHPTPAALALYLQRVLGLSTVAEEGPTPVTVPHGESVAIVGAGCRYAGSAESPNPLWQLVFDGREALVDFPSDRGWDLDGLYDSDRSKPGKRYVQKGGFL
ncbi:acyl carrier protein [Streptomyces sp. NBC_01451]|uniref:acyl carrier protein n=1 Tax=Streptomyces sp. NBC_01451 TaxID=2903872 RepID=UPI002E352A88|nr:beta-ketoacyl synthase N-terminal-like domain-containing protein [Streptomyces sp. NBC_01451]